MKNLAYTFIVVLSVLSVTSAFAEPVKKSFDEMKKSVIAETELFNQFDDINRVDSLQDYIGFAISNNKQLQSLYYSWAASLENVTVESALPDPTVGVGYFVENVETKVGPQNKKISLKQQFPWFGTLAAQKQAAYEKSNISYHTYTSFKQDLVFEVTKQYYLYWLLKKQIQTTEDNFLLLELWESIIRSKYKTAQASHPDLIKVQIELAKLEEQIVELQQAIIPAEIHLRTTLNLPLTVSMYTSDNINTEKSVLNKNEIMNRIEENNPELHKTIDAIFKDEAIRKLASKSTKPKFTIGVDYIETGESSQSSIFESGKDAWAVTASISIPLWFSKNKAKKNKAVHALQSSRLRYEQKKLEINDKLYQIIFAYDDAYRKINLYRDGLIPKAEQSMQVSLKGYQSGDVNIITLLESQKDLLEFQYALDKSIVSFALQTAAIQKITAENKYLPKGESNEEN